ncbi:tetratricopeptide repeat protein [Corallincola spongiicola]|uniref:Tetratricopeptide repeat protein n=2 Tax=Corallincola spongiicola TaxID=2520508 RepID=A0ABY1WNU7_9GAMM|nr:tetratricopeptide repeat protein [Corallincola spongiicola]
MLVRLSVKELQMSRLLLTMARVTVLSVGLCSLVIAAPINLTETKSQQYLEQAFTGANEMGMVDLGTGKGVNDLSWLNQVVAEGLYSQTSRNQILTLISNQDYLDAETAARKWIAERPADLTGHQLFILALLGQGKDQALSAHLIELKKLAPNLHDTTAFLAATGYAKKRQFYQALELLNSPLTGSSAQTLKGQILFQQGRVDEATKALKIALTTKPDNLGATVLVTKLSLATSQLHDAKRYAQIWQKLAPEDVGPSMVLSAVAMIDNQPSTAKKAITETLTRHPENYVAMLDLALIAWREGDLKTANSQLEKLKAVDSREPLQLASLMLLNSDNESDKKKLASTVAKLIEIDPNDPMHQLLRIAVQATVSETDLLPLSNLYIDLKDKSIRQQVATATNASWSSVAYSYYLYRQGYFAMLLADKTNNQNPLYQINLARGHWKSGDSDSAQRAYRAFQDANPKWVIPLLEVADIQYFLNGADAALSGYRQAHLKRQDWPELTVRLANLLFTSGKFEDALSYYQTLSSQYPKNGVFLAQIAMTELALKRNNEALVNAQKAHTLLPQHPEITKVLAQSFYSLRNWDKAQLNYLEALKQGVQLELTDLLNLAKSFEKSGNKKQEIRFLERTLNLGVDFQQANEVKQRLKVLNGA